MSARFMDYYLSSNLKKAEGYSDIATQTFGAWDENETRWKYPISYQFTYHPEAKEWTHERISMRDEQFEKVHGMDTWKVPETMMRFMKESFGKRAAFYDRVHNMLQKETIVVEPRELRETIGLGIYYLLEGNCEEDDVLIDIGLDKEKEVCRFTVSSGEGGRNNVSILFNDPSEHPNIQRAAANIAEQSDFRLKLLMAEWGE